MWGGEEAANSGYEQQKESEIAGIYKNFEGTPFIVELIYYQGL